MLTGIKGQYLLFDVGVFNVREHTGYEVEISIDPGLDTSVANSAAQIDLF